MNRREFIAGAACAGGYSLAGGPIGPAKRILRVGMITDTHFGNDYESTERGGLAWKLFRRLKTDMVVHLGDICDHHYPAGYEGFRRRIEEIWPSTAPDHPREAFVWAWHDYFRYQGDPDRNTPKRWEAIAAAQKLLKDPHELYDAFDLKGYSFVVVPQGADFKRYEKLLSEAAAKHPGQPFFVCDHVPPQDTVYNSRIWGDRRRLDLLSKFPDCIVLTGHVHQSLRVENSIWQGAFTVVNAGVMSSWDGNLVGSVPKSKTCHHCLVMDVYPDVVEFLRYDVHTGEELIGDARWRVPLPFDPKTAPYNPARRAETLGVAAFPAGATLAATAAEPFGGFALSFPSAVGAGDFEYRLEVAKRQADGSWAPYVRQDVFSEFHLAPRERTGRGRHAFSAGYFTPGERVAFTVTPVSPYGKTGRPLRTEATVPATAGSDAELVWESKDPMAECAAYTGLKDGTRLAAGADGYFPHETRELRLELPKTAWAGEKGTRFRFTVDLQMLQPNGGQWTLVLRNPEPMYNANARIATPKGDSGRQRYVIEFTQSDAAFWYYFLVREGTPGKIRFDYVRIERLKSAAPGPTFANLIAHRGESHDAPENTLPAYRTAVERGFGFECDVYLSADGRVFTFHDGDLRRTSGGRMTKRCNEANWETEISTLNVGGWGPWKGSKFDPTRPALLEEVCALARDGRWIYCEVKGGNTNVVPAIAKVLAAQKTATPSNFLFIAFNQGICAELKRALPQYRCYWLTDAYHYTWFKDRPPLKGGPVTADEVIATLRETGADGLDVSFDEELHTPAFVRRIHAAGYGFHVWTIDDPARAREAFRRGVDTVTTNCAKHIRESAY